MVTYTEPAKKSVVVAAALQRELAAVRRRESFVLLETGEGRENIRRAASLLDSDLPSLLVVLGYAGALSASLQPGDLVLAENFDGVEQHLEDLNLASRARLSDLPRLFYGTAVTTDAIIWNRSDKQLLSRRLNPGILGCVDMESSEWAEWCADRGVPFVVARCILDLYDESLPFDFNLYRDTDGRIRTGSLLIHALLNPGSLGLLTRLWRRSRLCSLRLALFLESFLSQQDKGNF